MSDTIAVCGGIGSGKSMVCRILSVMGYPVYDCDSEAKKLMDTDPAIKSAIAGLISPDCIKGDCIDRPKLSEIVFSDASKLEILNSIVHSAVRSHLADWIDSRRGRMRFVETAILYQSGLDRMVNEVWEVTAPTDIRLSRVMNRNGLTAEQVMSRIKSQDSFVPSSPHDNIHIIVNDGIEPLLPQIETLLKSGR